MNRYSHHKYTYTKPFYFAKHRWEFVCGAGGIHFHVSVNERYGDTAGLELHYVSPPQYMKDNAPSHMDCKLTGGRCWHDGTSLYAMETLWPIIKPMLRSGDHEMIFKVLEKQANSYFYAEEEGEGGRTELPVEVLVDAKQDRIHEEKRSARKVKVKREGEGE